MRRHVMLDSKSTGHVLVEDASSRSLELLKKNVQYAWLSSISQIESSKAACTDSKVLSAPRGSAVLCFQ